jgi:hypothetical protein
MGEPRHDRAFVAVGHVQVWDLVMGEPAGLFVFVADHRGCGAGYVAAVGNDDHILSLADVVLPAVKDGAGRHLPAGFLADLPDDARGRILAELELAAGQLPLRMVSRTPPRLPAVSAAFQPRCSPWAHTAGIAAPAAAAQDADHRQDQPLSGGKLMALRDSMRDSEAVSHCEVVLEGLSPNHCEVVLETLSANHCEVVLAHISPNHSEVVLGALISPNHCEVVLAGVSPNHSEVVLAGINPNHCEVVLGVPAG